MKNAGMVMCFIFHTIQEYTKINVYYVLYTSQALLYMSDSLTVYNTTIFRTELLILVTSSQILPVMSSSFFC